ncbi:MAG: cation:proton antiporter, partial [Candidatus Saccharimonadales bacterium]
MDSIFPGLSLIIVVATLVALIMRLIGQPLIIGHIITGIVVGPAILHLSKSPQILTIFSEIGIALLLFVIGLGLNPRVFKEIGKVAATIATAQIAVVGLAGWLLGRFLGFGQTESVFIGVALVFSSTIIALKLLSDKKEQTRLYGKITIGILLVQDAVAATALMLVASAGEHKAISLVPLVWLMAKALALGALMYFVSTTFLVRWQKLIAGSQEFLFLAAIGWGFGSAALFTKLGLSLEVGALFAGICLAPLFYAQEIAARLRPLRDFFMIVFFITLGAGVSFSGLGELLPAIVICSVVVIILKPLIVLLVMGLMGYTRRTSFKSAVSLAQLSEFSILVTVLGVREGLIGQEIAVLVTFVTLVSIAVSTYLIIFSDKLFDMFEKYLRVFERKSPHEDRPDVTKHDLVLFGYQRGGHEFVSLFEQLKKKYVVIDYDPEIIETLERNEVNHIFGDATDAELLEEAGLEKSQLVVSTIPEFQTNMFLLSFLKHKNPRAVVVLHSDDPDEAAKLYEAGADYVILPHYIGSEKVSSFIGKSGLTKSAFRKQRNEHLRYLEKHYGSVKKLDDLHEKRLGRAIMRGVP